VTSASSEEFLPSQVLCISINWLAQGLFDVILSAAKVLRSTAGKKVGLHM
jgi:hypothetical protein